MNFYVVSYYLSFYIQREKMQVKTSLQREKEGKNSSWEKFIDYLSLIIKLFFRFLKRYYKKRGKFIKLRINKKPRSYLKNKKVNCLT